MATLLPASIETIEKIKSAPADQLDAAAIQQTKADIERLKGKIENPDQLRSLQNLHGDIERRLDELKSSASSGAARNALDDLRRTLNYNGIRPEFRPLSSKMEKGTARHAAAEVAEKAVLDTGSKLAGYQEQFLRDHPKAVTTIAAAGLGAFLLKKLWDAARKAKDTTKETGSRLWKWLRRGLTAAGIWLTLRKIQEATGAPAATPTLANMPPEKAVPQLVSVLTKEFTAAKTEAAAREAANKLNAAASPVSVAKTNPQWLSIQRDINAQLESGLNQRKDVDYTVFLEGGVKVTRKPTAPVTPPAPTTPSTPPSSPPAAPAATPPPAAASTPPTVPKV